MSSSVEKEPPPIQRDVYYRMFLNRGEYVVERVETLRSEVYRGTSFEEAAAVQDEANAAVRYAP